MEASNSNLLENWANYVILVSYVFFAVALLIVLVHEIRIMMTANEKDRYDYVNHHEIKYFWYAIIAFIAGFSLFLTTVVMPLIEVDREIKLFVGLFLMAVFVIISYMVLSNLVQTLYPRFLESRLVRIRNKVRISSAGNRMRKLSSEEGSVHLDAGQLAEHKSDIHSIEYDVWLDEKTGEKRIEKYMTYEHAEKCDECGYYTLRIDREEVLKQPGDKETGILVEHYQCHYCNHREAKEVVIASLSSNVVGATG